MAELCAGFGGLTMAALLAGWDVELAWYAETDRDARRVMEAHHPGVPNAGDITTAQFSAQEPVDVLTAGWPCTPASMAGQRRGSADDRWLWPDVARAVRVLRPAVFVGENVPGLLTIEGGRLFGGVLADLDGFGYTVRWTTVGACRVGLCHHRHRVFIVATWGAGGVEPAGWPLARRSTGSGWETAADTLFGAGSAPHWPAAGTVHGGRAWAEPCSPCGEDGVVLLPTPNATDSQGGPRAVPPVRTHDGPDHGPRLRDVAAALLPTPGARLGDGRGAPDADLAAARLDSGRRNLDDAIALLPTPTAMHTARNATANRRAPKPTTSTDGWTLADVAYADRWRHYGAAVRRHELVTGRRAPEPTEPNTKGGVRLAAAFTEWMLALPAGWVTDHVGRNPALARLGNGIAVPAAAYALSLLLPSGPVRPELAGVGR
jgi:DNA (cytosine-5)-methyltransferase 1